MNKAKAKGTKFESDVVACLQGHGHEYAERRALSGNVDKGDIAGLPGVVIECKDHRRMELAAWMDEAEVEQKNAMAPMFFVVHKRLRRPIGKAYATTTLDLMAELVK